MNYERTNKLIDALQELRRVLVGEYMVDLEGIILAGPLKASRDFVMQLPGGLPPESDPDNGWVKQTKKLCEIAHVGIYR